MRIAPLLGIFLLGILATTLPAVAAPGQNITMTLPEAVLQEAVSKTLPLTFKMKSGSLQGTISIDKIEDLRLKQGALTSHIGLSGHDLKIVTSIAGQAFRMKIGNLAMDFQCDATIRYEAATQTLFIRPSIRDLQSADRGKKELASALALLFNNREFPLQIAKLQPLTAATGNTNLSISMDITEIALQPQGLLLAIRPKIESLVR